ncbi:MAG: cupredoxin family copper-binding protein [Pseudolabrys sp.]
MNDTMIVGMKKLLLSTVSAVAVIAILTAAPAGAEETQVKIDNFTFSPQQLTVKSGATVTWINQDDIPHVVVSDVRQFKSNALDTDDKFSFTFSTPGIYKYFCALHPHMTGIIVVQAATGSNAPR